jgi:hypothetical protein
MAVLRIENATQSDFARCLALQNRKVPDRAQRQAIVQCFEAPAKNHRSPARTGNPIVNVDISATRAEIQHACLASGASGFQ